MKLTPLADNVIIESLTKEEKTKSGIILPEPHEKERSQEGKVIAVGPGKILDSGARKQMSVKIGNKVLFTKYGPNEIKIEGEDGKMKEYLIAKEEDILAIVE